MSIGKVTRNFQITIPALIRKVLKIEVGSMVDFVLRDNEVVLKPKVTIDQEQAWFWTDEWQEAEKEVNESKKKGNLRKFKNINEMKKYFEK